MNKTHTYKVTTTWNGNKGTGTSGVKDYDRSHTASLEGKPELYLTTDNAAVGDKNKLNPEDLLVTAVSSCHMLSYLYLCSLEGIIVTDYSDNAIGMMIENEDGGGKFSEVALYPKVTVQDITMIDRAIDLHQKAHTICYIANSLNFPVYTKPTCIVEKHTA